MHPPFLIGESFKFGWHKVRQHSALVFQVVLTLFACQVAIEIVQKVLAGRPLGVLAVIALCVVMAFLGTGATLITLKLARGQHASYADLLPPVALVWRFVCAAILSGLIVLAGLLLIVPGVYLLLRYGMVRFVVLDGAGVTESLGKSAALTRGVKWRLLGFFAAVVALNILGVFLFYVGLLITVPVSMIAYAHVYEKLKARHHHA